MEARWRWHCALGGRRVGALQSSEGCLASLPWWTRVRALAFSMKACTGILPKGHCTCSTPSSFQAAHELACQVGRAVHLGVQAIHSEGIQLLAGPQPFIRTPRSSAKVGLFQSQVKAASQRCKGNRLRKAYVKVPILPSLGPVSPLVPYCYVISLRGSRQVWELPAHSCQEFCCSSEDQSSAPEPPKVF